MTNIFSFAWYIPGTFLFGRFGGKRKMVHIEEANAGIAIATARFDDDEIEHFSSQKLAKIKRGRYGLINLKQTNCGKRKIRSSRQRVLSKGKCW